ncbi:MAG: TonB-dependent receptor [Bacteroides sp.]|nr:TonB-dependent receptor [Bacteroides sp.]
MKNRLTMLLGMLCFVCMAFAQHSTTPTFTVKGILVDSLSLEGEPYATIKIVKKETPDKAVKMAVTDMKGKFQERFNAETGEYTLTISSIGKTTVEKDFMLEAGNNEVDLGTLYTSEATNELGAVEIVAQKPLVRADIDKIEYNIQDDPDSQSNSILEMLRKVPLVTVDGEDKIQVNGSSSFKVHVNGKPNPMMSDNPTEVLKSMPANTIKHIEVITNPGAKYDAEGVGGILNIVTLGGGFEGYTVTFSANGSNTGGGGSLYGTVQKGKFTLSGRYGFNLNDRPYNYYNGRQERTEEETVLTSYNRNKGKGTFQHGSLEASYEIDTLRLVTASFGMYGGNNNNKSTAWASLTDLDPLSSRAAYYRYDQTNKNDGSWYSVRGNIDYQRSFPTVKDRMLTLSYKIDTRPQTSDYKLNYTYDPEAVDENYKEFLAELLRDQHSDGKQTTTEHTFQGDFTTPIGEIHTLETGLKYISRNNTSDNKRYLADGMSHEYIYDPDGSSHYKHLNDIVAVYAGYALKYKKFSGRVGVRYEHTAQHIKYQEKPDQNFKTTTDDVVPSVSFGFKLGQTQNIRAGYNMRIWRPSIYYLNPYVDDTNPTHIRSGNPKLETEKNHAFDVSYSNFTSKFNVNLSLRHSFNNNSIEEYSVLINPAEIPNYEADPAFANQDVLYTTYGNIGKASSTGLSGYINWNASPKTRIYTNLNGSYRHMSSSALDLSNSGWNLFAYGGVQHTFPLDIRASLNLMGSTPYISLQRRGYSFYDYSFSVNHSFVNKRLTLSAFAGNFFTKYTKSSNTSEGQGYKDWSENKYSRRRFGISISYRIGELTASVKKAARTISNDDVKDGGGGGGSE